MPQWSLPPACQLDTTSEWSLHIPATKGTTESGDIFPLHNLYQIFSGRTGTFMNQLIPPRCRIGQKRFSFFWKSKLFVLKGGVNILDHASVRDRMNLGQSGNFLGSGIGEDLSPKKVPVNGRTEVCIPATWSWGSTDLVAAQWADFFSCKFFQDGGGGPLRAWSTR